MTDPVVPQTYEASQLEALLPYPSKDANKYTRGHLYLVAGSHAYPGAAALASLASQRCGTGYTQVICAPESVNLIRSVHPSLVVESWDGFDFSSLAAPRPGHPIACVVGSGFDGNDPEQNARALEVIAHVVAPVLADGGALRALASDRGLEVAAERAKLGRELVLTPHGGEAKALADAAHLALDVAQDETQACTLARELSQAYQALIVLKGPNTYLSNGDRVVAMRLGTPALAKAGTGDVLAGMIGSFLAQGLDPLDAAVLGATLHAEAGAFAARKVGEISVVAEDVIASIPEAIMSL